MKRKGTWVSPVALLLLAGATGYGQTGSEDSESVDSLKSDGGAQRTVELLDPGAEPRRELRYKFQPNHTETMVVETTNVMTVEKGNGKQPPIEMPTVRTTVKIYAGDLSPEGNLPVGFKLHRVDLTVNSEIDPAIVNGMRENVRRMLGLYGSATVTPRGLAEDEKIHVPPGVDAKSKSLLESLKKSFNQIVPLPAEPVGKGARWRVPLPVETPQASLTPVYIFTLSDLQGDKAKFDVKAKQGASPKKTDPPDAAPDENASLESQDSFGTGTMEIDLTKLVGTVDMSVTAVKYASSGDRKIRITIQEEMKVHP